ncbi:hypothetical protein B0H13DRAFT_2422234 [Mycena leptocephala]|nr:hypothetical protein B0H13DRAFT_2422234 [Mycena leptocephala]
MHTILTSAPNITDLFLTLCIWGSDSAQGLCSGLPAINPQRVIVVDAVEYDQKPKKNKQVTQLLETLVDIIPKWDKMQIFDFPYRPLGDGHTTLDARAEALASALRQSHSLETLLVRAGNTFPDYFREMDNVPSFKSLRMTLPESNFLGIISGRLRSAVAEDPKLKVIVTL